VRGQRLLQPAAIARFYEGRKGAHAWDGGDAEQIVQSVRDIVQDGLNPADYHLAALERIRDSARAARPALAADLDILLTDAVAGMMDHTRFGRVRPVTLDSTWNVDPRAGAPPLESTLARIAEAVSRGKPSKSGSRPTSSTWASSGRSPSCASAGPWMAQGSRGEDDPSRGG